MCPLKRHIVMAINMVVFVMVASFPLAIAADVPLMTKETLKDHLEKGDVVVVDVRQGRDWDASEFKIKGAQRVESKDLDDWAQMQDKSKKMVLYCA